VSAFRKDFLELGEPLRVVAFDPARRGNVDGLETALHAVLVGENELMDDSVTVRDMKSGEQLIVKITELSAELSGEE